MASAAIQRSVSERALQTFLGHADLRSTQRYVRLSGTRARVGVRPGFVGDAAVAEDPINNHKHTQEDVVEAAGLEPGAKPPRSLKPRGSGSQFLSAGGASVQPMRTGGSLLAAMVRGCVPVWALARRSSRARPGAGNRARCGGRPRLARDLVEEGDHLAVDVVGPLLLRPVTAVLQPDGLLEVGDHCQKAVRLRPERQELEVLLTDEEERRLLDLASAS